MRFFGGLTAVLLFASCECGPPPSSDAGADAGRDAGAVDAGAPDAGAPDAGRIDAGPPDAGPPDAGPDGGPPDSGPPDLCGDGVRQSWELCDDGNRDGGDGCNRACSGVEHLFTCPDAGGACVDLVACGDLRIQAAESCEDGNRDGGDGCGSDCVLEAGWRCPVSGAPCLALRCGDMVVRGTEDCDDGNTAAGDGCSATCRIEPGYACAPGGGPCTLAFCGDRVTHPTESCDDGNANFDDGCTPICTSEPDCASGTCLSRCGDRLFQPDAGEQCDDGDLRPGDGCSPACTIETGYTCTPRQPSVLTLPIVLRDFRDTHPDFEAFVGDDPDIVLPMLGADGKPAYARSDGGRSLTTSGKEAFDQWYNDVPDANFQLRRQLALEPTDAGLRFGSTLFFPFDDAGFGNQGRSNNFHFTTETRFWFIHTGAEEMHFIGDDDVFIYVNGRLAVNLGGVHMSQSGDLVLDVATGATFGMSLGGLYEVALFHAERHTVGSTFQLTLKEFDFELSSCARACGNAEVDRTEECDDGLNDGGYGKCGPGCRYSSWCGDGVTQPAHELCDDGVNATPYGSAGCSPACATPARCGDGRIDGRFGEECDDANPASGDGCSACRLER